MSQDLLLEHLLIGSEEVAHSSIVEKKTAKWISQTDSTVRAQTQVWGLD